MNNAAKTARNIRFYHLIKTNKEKLGDFSELLMWRINKNNSNNNNNAAFALYTLHNLTKHLDEFQYVFTSFFLCKSNQMNSSIHFN